MVLRNGREDGGIGVGWLRGKGMGQVVDIGFGVCGVQILTLPMWQFRVCAPYGMRAEKPR
jgi:hypothetical protein